MSDITASLNAGDDAPDQQLILLLYDELRARARRYLSGQPAGHTLQTTALVHEAFIKLLGPNPQWHDARHFYNAAAEVMRQILVSHARAKSAQKRGGVMKKLPLGDMADPLADADNVDWEFVDRAMEELKKLDERRYRVVMLRYFAGLSEQQTAEALEVSQKTIKRDWQTAKAFLRVRLAEFVR